MKTLYAFALLSLALFSCSEDTPEPVDTSVKGQLQGEWLPASPAAWTFYGANTFEREYRPTTHAYRFIGDSVYVSVVGDGTGYLVADKYTLSEENGKQTITLWNDFAQTDVASFELEIANGGMQWTSTEVAPVQYTANGKQVDTDSTRVVMKWKKR